MTNTTKKIYKEVDTIQVDKETGEISSQTKELSSYVSSEPPFVKMYLDDLILLNNLPKLSSDLLYELIKLINYENKIVLNGALKKDIAKKINVEPKSLNNTLTKFGKKDILIRLDTGIYMVNPELFARGSWTDIRKIRGKYLQLKITYDENHRVISTVMKDRYQKTKQRKQNEDEEKFNNKFGERPDRRALREYNIAKYQENKNNFDNGESSHNIENEDD